MKSMTFRTRLFRILFPLLTFGALSLACTLVEQIPEILPTQVPVLSPTATLPPPTPEPTPTATLPPTPTPLPAARIESGDRARFAGDWDRALSEYEAALATSPDAEIQSAALLGIARTRNSMGDPDIALDALNRLMQNYPQSAHIPYAHFAIGQALAAQGRHSEAADAYLNYLIVRPGLVDSYILNLRGDTLAAAGRYGEALVDYRGALQAPGFLDVLGTEIKIAQAHASVGDYPTALGMYQDIYNRTDNDFTKAQMDLLMGQAYTAQGNWEQAVVVFQDAVNNYPRSFDSYQALVVLVDAGVPVDELNRGIVDYFAGEYGVATTAFDRYLQLGGADPAAAIYYYGLSLRAQGGNQDAITRWDEIIQNYPDHRFWDDAWEQKAYTQWAFLGLFPEATQTLLDFVAVASAHARAGEFLFDAGLVAEKASELEQAAQIWERMGAEYPGDERAPHAIFLAGVTRYRLGDYAGAINVFQVVLERATTAEERAAAYLWQGKCRQALDDAAGAASAWELAANIDPTGYYSERALDLLRQRTPFQPPEMFDLAVELAGERPEAENWMRTTFTLPEGTDLSSPAILLGDGRMLRGAELWELGLYDEARTEFESLRQSLLTDPVGSFIFANYLFELGMYRSAILATRQVLDLAGMGDAQTLNAPVYFNHIRFGAYFSDLVLPAAQEYGFHPLFLFSVIRQESAYEGFVRSSAGARGLMQIMPPTGEEIARDLGWPPEYSAEDLYRPLVSVRMGAQYLAKWREYFHDDVYAALAAYNGGPGNAIEWKEMAGDDPDLLLELVRYEETRNYIRGIYEIFNLYRRIYNRTP
jgi:soluble lytic murein transglycosylase